ncbi:HEAT repeat domain-containing protein [bacterium]|nr:HEAT repeat domain-containing protein [bacterium]
MKPAVIGFSLFLVLFLFLIYRYYLSNISLLWIVVFSCSAAATIFLYAREIIRMFLAPRRMKRFISTNTEPNTVVAWLKANRLQGEAGLVQDKSPERISFFAGLTLFILLFELMPWKPDSGVGHVFRFLVYLTVSWLTSFVFSLVWLVNTLQPAGMATIKKLQQLVKGSPVETVWQEQVRAEETAWQKQKQETQIAGGYATEEVKIASFERELSEALRSGADRTDESLRLGRFCENDIRRLLAFLRSTDSLVRELATSLSARRKGPEVIDALITTSKDEVLEVRQAAVHGLVSLKDPKVVPALLEALNDKDEWVRSSAVSGLGHFPDPKVQDALYTLTQDPSSEVRCASATSLVKLDDNRALGCLKSLLTDSDKYIRIRASRALGDFGDKSANEELLTVAKSDSDAEVRMEATRSMLRNGDTRAYGILVAVLLNESKWWATRSTSAARKLLDELNPNWIQTHAAHHLIPQLSAAYVEGKYTDDGKAAYSLLQSFGPDAIQSDQAKETVRSLISRLKDSETHPRHAAVKLLGLFADQIAVLPLIEALQDSSGYVAADAARALARIKDPRAVDPLIQHLDGLGACATEALAEIGDKKAIEPLLNRLLQGFGAGDDVILRAVEKIDPGGEFQEAYRQTIKKLLDASAGAGIEQREHALSVLSIIKSGPLAKAFQQMKRGIEDSWLTTLTFWKDSELEEEVTYDNSIEIREANSLALEKSSAEEGISRLKQIAAAHPDCSAPYCLTAQALVKLNKEEEAEQILLHSLELVKKKSHVADSLGYFYFQRKNDLPKSIQWYAISVYAQREQPSLWAPHLYLSGIFSGFGIEDAAHAMRERANIIYKNPVHLSSEWTDKLRFMQSLISEGSAKSVLTRVWQELRKWEIPVASEIVKESRNEKPKTGETGYCQMCGKPGTGFQVWANRAFFLCSKLCEDRYGKTRAEAIQFQQVSIMMDGGTGVADAVRAARKRAFEADSYCWFCGKVKRMGDDFCQACKRQTDIELT